MANDRGNVENNMLLQHCVSSAFYSSTLHSKCEDDRVYQGHLSLSNVSMRRCDIKHPHELQLQCAEKKKNCNILFTSITVFLVFVFCFCFFFPPRLAHCGSKCIVNIHRVGQ